MRSSALPIVLKDLAFRPDGRSVIDGLSASIVSQGITAIVGPNGAGKSVTLRLLDKLIEPDAGSIRFGDRDAAEVRRALVFQRPGLIRASVADNVALALTSEKMSRNDKSARVAAALGRVGLQGRAHDAARRLSGGEQQRLALARAWVIEPDVLLLDEPTASLDPSATDAIEKLIAGIAHTATKVILVSHNLGQVARLAEDVLVLTGGRAVEHGPTRTVLTAPRTPAAQAYINAELPWTPLAATS